VVVNCQPTDSNGIAAILQTYTVTNVFPPNSIVGSSSMDSKAGKFIGILSSCYKTLRYRLLFFHSTSELEHNTINNPIMILRDHVIYWTVLSILLIRDVTQWIHGVSVCHMEDEYLDCRYHAIMSIVARETNIHYNLILCWFGSGY